MSECRNCHTSFEGNFCSQCGTNAVVKRIDKHYITHEFKHAVLHLEGGFFYTIKELITRPGHSIREFIEGHRNRHFKPLGFLVICSLIYAFFSSFIAREVPKDKVVDNVSKALHWIPEHMNYANMIEVVFLVFFLRLFFKKTTFNFYEYSVFFCYIVGFVTLFSIPYDIISTNLKWNPLYSFYWFLAGIVYACWAIGQFIHRNSLGTYLKIFLAYFLGYFTFVFIFIIIGEVLNFINK